MLDSLRRSSTPTNLLDIIGEVRTRWRTKGARGVLAVAGIGSACHAGRYGMEARLAAPRSRARVAMLVVLAA